MNIKTSCYKCMNRVIGCHTNCEKYKLYRAQLAVIKRNKEIEKQRLCKTKRRSYSL